LTKISYKKLLHLGVWVCVAAGLSSSLAFAVAGERKVKVTALAIDIDRNDENVFITADELRSEFTSGARALMDRSYADIDIPSVEKSLNAHPCVAECEVAGDVSGKVHIHVRQREPVLRIITRDGESYYLDTDGRLMPLCESFTARVPVATGEIIEPYSRRSAYTISQIAGNAAFRELSVLDDLAAIAGAVHADSLLAGLVQQINVTKDREFEIIPVIGDHRIILGDATELDVKFRKLKLFYREGLSHTNGWGKYSVVNLKFKNLVVCTKR
jgi:cell division protein FtsQ